MSETLLSTFINAVSIVLAALITTFGTMVVAQQTNRRITLAMAGLACSIGGFIGLIIGIYISTNVIKSSGDKAGNTPKIDATLNAVIIIATAPVSPAPRSDLVPTSQMVNDTNVPMLPVSQPNQTPTSQTFIASTHTFPQDGVNLTLPNNSWWVCSGDLFLSRGGGEHLDPLFSDSDPKTGQIIVIEARNQLTISGPQGGYCELASSDKDERDALVTAKVAIMKQPQSGNCERGCNAVNVKELDATGAITDRGLK